MSSRDKPTRGKQTGSDNGGFSAWLRAGGPVSWILKLGGLAAAIAAIVGLVFTVDPGLRPAPNSCGPNRDASLTGVTIARGTYRQYLGYAHIAPSKRSAAELARNGVIVWYTLRAPANKGTTFTLSSTLLRAPNNIIVPPSLPLLLVRPDRCPYTEGQPVWVPNHAGRGRYVIQLQLDAPGTSATPKRSQTFSFS